MESEKACDSRDVACEANCHYSGFDAVRTNSQIFNTLEVLYSFISVQ